METVHRSKVDAWIALVLWAAFAMSLGACVLVATLRPEHWIVIVALLVVVWGLVGLIAWPVEYRIGSDVLIVRSGLLRWRVPLSAIEEVSPTRNATSSPAFSLDRLAVTYRQPGGMSTILISPVSKARFYDDLRAVAPHLRPLGDGLRIDG